MKVRGIGYRSRGPSINNPGRLQSRCRMPLHVDPLSRRKFLARTAALGVGLLSAGCAQHSNFGVKVSRTEPDAFDFGPSEQWALMSDPHIAASTWAMRGSCNMAR